MGLFSCSRQLETVSTAQDVQGDQDLQDDHYYCSSSGGVPWLGMQLRHSQGGWDTNSPRGLLAVGQAWNTSLRRLPGGVLVRCLKHQTKSCYRIIYENLEHDSLNIRRRFRYSLLMVSHHFWQMRLVCLVHECLPPPNLLLLSFLQSLMFVSWAHITLFKNSTGSLNMLLQPGLSVFEVFQGFASCS